MANECFNEIEVSGKKTEIDRLLDFVKSEENGDFDFNKIIPYPDNFKKLDKDSKDNSAGFKSGGYEWCLENWGTKWNSMSPDIEYPVIKENTELAIAIISYFSAWSPALPITSALAKMFPLLKFKHTYEEMNDDFSGFQVYENGVLVEEKVGTYEDYCLEWTNGSDSENEEENEL